MYVLYVCMFTHTHMCAPAYTHTCMCVCIHTCTYVCVTVHVICVCWLTWFIRLIIFLLHQQTSIDCSWELVFCHCKLTLITVRILESPTPPNLCNINVSMMDNNQQQPHIDTEHAVQTAIKNYLSMLNNRSGN